jgi:hypothetical protein
VWEHRAESPGGVEAVCVCKSRGLLEGAVRRPGEVPNMQAAEVLQELMAAAAAAVVGTGFVPVGLDTGSESAAKATLMPEIKAAAVKLDIKLLAVFAGLDSGFRCIKCLGLWIGLPNGIRIWVFISVGTSSVNNVCALALSLMQLVGTNTGRACRRP